MLIRLLNCVRLFCSANSKSVKMKYLCVAEKNDAAKTISSILSRGASQRREGYSQYNKIYEFDMNVRGQDSRVIFTSVSGHLLGYDFVNTFRSWRSCNPEQLFEAPVVKQCPENFVNIKNTLEREIRTCHSLIIWTDCDREGENIGFEIIDVCRAIKPSISIFRAKFSDMTAPSIYRAIENLGIPDERMSQAVDVRSELDLRIGAAFTRFQTMRLQSLFPDNVNNDLVSYGSCQFPTLGFVADRYREIEKFVSTDFWKIKLTHKMNNLTVEFYWARNRLFDKACCEAILVVCKSINQAIITNVQQKPKRRWRPQAMDTVELEKTGSRKLKLSAKEIMTIAEKLYTQGFISYPRTETNKFPPDMKLLQFVEMQTSHPEWGAFAEKVIQWGPNPRNGNKSDQAHPPIHPTKFSNSLIGNEKKVYELVVRHFLACVSKDAVGSETQVNAKVGDEEFNATGLVIFERNYLEVYVYEKWTGKEIHHYEVGSSFVPSSLTLHEGKTSPPSLLTEADLIALMEKHGIGTDATHAEHISTIKERGYIGVIDGGYLVPGTLGMGLVEGYELMNLQLSQPQLRAGLEIDLKGICDGTKNPADVLRQQIEIYKECYQVITRQVAALDRAVANRFGKNPQNVNSMQQAVPTLSIHDLFKCPKCKNCSMIIRQKKDQSPYIACQGYPACKHAIWFDRNHVKQIISIDEKCTSCGGLYHKVKIKFSQPYMLVQVDEVPAYSRIEEGYYITCLYCDGKVRDVLQIKADDVKCVGNIVGASSNPIHSSVFHSNNGIINNNNIRNNTNNNTNNSGSLQSRSFGTIMSNGSTQQRRNWFDDDIDDNNDNHRPNGGGGLVASTNTNQRFNTNVRNSSGSVPDINCHCNKKASKNITKKEGPNKGRAFYKCDQCKFFHWADIPIPMNIQQPPQKNSFQNHQQQRNSFVGNVQNGLNVSVGQRKCGFCRQPGHTKKNCPSMTH